jgi:nucleoside-diphosphate-sugar epimerase
MVRVLITGGAGFVGGHLVESQLSRGHRVRTVDLHATPLAALAGLVEPGFRPQLETLVGDITDPTCVRQLVEGVDVVYHLASAHLDTRLPESHYRRVNVAASVSLLDAAIEAGVKRFVHCSSVGVIGDVQRPPADEETPLHPTNMYERTKLEGERAVLQRAAELGFPIMVVRPAWVYGPRCPRTAKLISGIRKGRFLFFGDGCTLRHPIYIADAVTALERCVEAQPAPSGSVYIIAGERWLTVAELVQTLASVVGVPVPSLHLPIWFGKAAGYAMEVAYRPLGKPAPFSRRSMDFFLKDNAYDTAKAERELGFRAQVDLRSGLERSLEWLDRTAAPKAHSPGIRPSEGL